MDSEVWDPSKLTDEERKRLKWEWRDYEKQETLRRKKRDDKSDSTSPPDKPRPS